MLFVPSGSTSTDWLFWVGQTLNTLHRYPEAAERLEAALMYQPDHWQARLEYLAAHPHCRKCSEIGTVRKATVVDHVIPHRGNDRLFWFRGNWQPLCERCHNSAKQREERRSGW